MSQLSGQEFAECVLQGLDAAAITIKSLAEDNPRGLERARDLWDETTSIEFMRWLRVIAELDLRGPNPDRELDSQEELMYKLLDTLAEASITQATNYRAARAANRCQE